VVPPSDPYIRHAIFKGYDCARNTDNTQPCQPLFDSGSVCFALPSGGRMWNKIAMDMVALVVLWSVGAGVSLVPAVVTTKYDVRKQSV
jgi:hypothetical protein